MIQRGVRAKTLGVCVGLVVAWVVGVLMGLEAHGVEEGKGEETIELKAWNVPKAFAVGPIHEADRQIVSAFRAKHPWVNPVSPSELTIPGGSRTMDMAPLMQIAGGIAPDVLYVNFRQSQTYIQKKLLYPLDQYVERLAGVTIKDGAALETGAYLAALKMGVGWEQVEQRVPQVCWDVMRRRCPYEDECPYRKEWGLAALKTHQHVWAYPMGPLVIGLVRDRTLFAEHADEGIEQRSPVDWEEMLRWAKILTNPEQNEFGLQIYADKPGWIFLTFLYSAGGEAVRQNENGDWYCVLDSDEAVETAYFYARLRLEKIERGGKTYRGVVKLNSDTGSGPVRFGMTFEEIDERFLSSAVDLTKSYGPVPAGPGGKRHSMFNSMMSGVFSGLKHEPRRRDAAWEYLLFSDGTEARRIRVEKLVEAGMGQLVQPKLLRQFNENGRYDATLRQIPREMEEFYRVAFDEGVPEPYGKNCKYIYDYINNPIGAIWRDEVVREAVDAGYPGMARERIRAILKDATAKINQKMLGQLPASEQRVRGTVSWAVIVLVMVVFAFVLKRVFRAFTPSVGSEKAGEEKGGGWEFWRHRWAYLLMAPAVASIGLWMYWPMVQGTMIAFQDYSILGDSRWVGSDNFAAVLYDGEFWHSMKVTVVYAVLFMVFGFGAPIILAFLLQEVPRGTVLFRTVYYIPAILSGVVVIFLWKSFYAPEGLINQVINAHVYVLNFAFRTRFEEFRTDWLDDEYMALFFCLLPTVWAGVGPGCLIYLAALKTIPEELYEAADIDGAGLKSKIMHISFPSIKSLVLINFIGAMIGAIRDAGGFILAMTGGGPYTQSGGATEITGLMLFYTSFGHLDFGRAAAMAWVLGSILIGFTVIQLQRLSKLEFRTAGKVG